MNRSGTLRISREFFEMKKNGKTLELLKQIEKKGIPLLDCIVYHKGNCVFRYISGHSDEAGRKPADGTERYNIYSCSKIITAAAVLQLVENDTIRLDDPVYEYLPEFRHMKKSVDEKLEDVKTTMTIRHLFTMTAGLTYNIRSENIRRGIEETHGVMQTREAMKYLACDPLVFEPGSSWKYSLCLDVLAAVAEVASGKRFGLYVKENVFDRVGMKRSSFLLPDEELHEIAAQYCYDAQNGKYVPCGPGVYEEKLGSEYESGGSGCISTVEDCIAVLEALRCGETILRRDTIARMTCPQISREAEKACHILVPSNYSYGLGVRCPRPDGAAGDYGWGGSSGAYLAVFPEAEISFFYAQHVQGSPAQMMRRDLTETILADIF